MFDIRRANALRAVAEHGTIAAAAEALHVTSSALSQQLAKLETEVGQPLLVRRGRGVELTDAGTLLVEHTAEIVARIRSAEAALQAHQGDVMGRMSITAFATAMRAIVPSAVRMLQADHPLLRVESHEHESAEAVRLLLRGDVDVAVIEEWSRPSPILPDGLAAAHLLDDVADLAVPAGHHLSKSGAVVDIRACVHEQWLSWRAGEFGHEWLNHKLAAHGQRPHFAHTAGEHQTLLALVAAGLGIALMPRLGRGPVPKGVVIKRLNPSITRRCFALWRTAAGERPAITATVESLVRAVTACAQNNRGVGKREKVRPANRWV